MQKLLNYIEKKKIMFSLLAIVILITTVTYQYFNETSAVISLGMIGKTITIDAGHGGFDPGAVGATGVLEKDVNLAISTRLAEFLRLSGANVIELRTTDEALGETKTEDMTNRLNLAKNSGADLCIMIHSNSIAQEEYFGAQVFYYKNSEEGEILAKYIQDSIFEILGNTSRTENAIEDIYIMKNQDIPVIIVEVGFLSNEVEEQLLIDSDYQTEMAFAIYKGIVNYYTQ